MNNYRHADTDRMKNVVFIRFSKPPNHGRIPAEQTGRLYRCLYQEEHPRLFFIFMLLFRVAMYFRSYFLESCKYMHFWKAQTFLKPKTNLPIIELAMWRDEARMYVCITCVR